ncbi:MAG: AbrB/MazE/SpoVT family DNA-binding domain-containing protein [Deltaproteobacteria bacterium]|nr:AbrB/MazE/SpoVT family DNA-binding domain-containing protein [Deltaproteobacteria bacterium]
MTITMDASGRLVVPKSVRDAAGFPVGAPLDVRFRDGRIEIEPPPVQVSIERRGHVFVALAGPRQPPLTGEAVADTLGRIRAERG